MSVLPTQSSFIDREVYRKESRRRLRASEPEQNFARREAAVTAYSSAALFCSLQDIPSL